jgi:hypothetical protein
MAKAPSMAGIQAWTAFDRARAADTLRHCPEMFDNQHLPSPISATDISADGKYLLGQEAEIVQET